ncbi:MAG: DUF58 domain-containing protein, partial [Bacteroidia bacterium]|nr:DUF58 domain-containing protein [Bacteroidia bacterium]
HDLVAIRVNDEKEKALPDIGLVKFVDAESGKTIWVDTSDANIRKQIEKISREQDKKLSDTFNRSGVDNVTLMTDQSYVRPLMNLFKKREKRF